MTDGKEIGKEEVEQVASSNSHNRTISFITTHPNVSISLFKFERERNTNLEVFRNHNIKEKTRKTRQYETRISFSNGLAYKVWNSSNKNSRWSFDPRNGLTLQNPTVSDSANYYVFGHLPFVNGKPVNITHSNDSFKRHRIQNIIRKIFPVDRIDAIDVILFAFDDPGNKNL
jgi:hypothetical protein